MRGTSRSSEQLTQSGKCVWIAVVAVNVIELFHESREDRVIQPGAVRQNAATCALLELIKRPSRVCDANYRNTQCPASDQVVQRRNNFLVGEIASRTKKDESIGLDAFRVRSFCQRVFYVGDRFTSHDNISSSV